MLPAVEASEVTPASLFVLKTRRKRLWQGLWQKQEPMVIAKYKEQAIAKNAISG